MPTRYDLLDTYGNVISLDRRLVLGTVDGLGMPPVKHVTQRQYQMEGALYLSTHLEPRVVTFNVDTLQCTEMDLWDVRAAFNLLLSQFAPGFTLRAGLPSGQRYCCDLRYDGALTGEIDQHASALATRLTVQAIAFDPALYDPLQVQTVYNMGDVVGGHGFPLSFPVSLGYATSLAVIGALVYPGTWRTYPIFRITGPASNILITNTTTGEKLDLGNFVPGPGLPDLAGGHYIEIDCRPGYKTIYVDGSTPALFWLTDDSDLGTFHIERAPEASGGQNAITYSVDDVDSTTSIGLSYYTRFIGI